MERVFSNLKMARVWQNGYANHAQAINDIANYIDGAHNSRRLHSTQGNVSANGFELELTLKNNITLFETT